LGRPNIPGFSQRFRKRSAKKRLYHFHSDLGVFLSRLCFRARYVPFHALAGDQWLPRVWTLLAAISMNSR
jgi:hypothetical protein